MDTVHTSFLLKRPFPSLIGLLTLSLSHRPGKGSLVSQEEQSPAPCLWVSMAHTFVTASLRVVHLCTSLLPHSIVSSLNIGTFFY